MRSYKISCKWSFNKDLSGIYYFRSPSFIFACLMIDKDKEGKLLVTARICGDLINENASEEWFNSVKAAKAWVERQLGARKGLE